MKKLIAGWVLILSLGGCTSPLTKREKGALLGGAAGALGGGLIGDQLQSQDRRIHRLERRGDQ